MGRPLRLRLLLAAAVVALSALAAGCQQQSTTLSGWVNRGERSAAVLLEAPEVELAAEAVPGAQVTVRERERGGDRLVAQVRTDGTGHFSVTVLREPGGWGRWQLTVEKPGFRAASTGWSRLAARGRLYWQVTLAPEAISDQPQGKKPGSGR